MTTPQLTDDELRDLAHSAYEEAMSFGLSVDTFLRYFKGIRNRLAQPAAAPPAPGGDVQALRDALQSIKSLVVGDKHPRWADDTATYLTRCRVADIADAALQSTQGQTASAITSHLKTLESKYMEWCGYGRMPLTEGQFKYLLDKIAAEVTAPTATQGQDAAPAEQPCHCPACLRGEDAPHEYHLEQRPKGKK